MSLRVRMRWLYSLGGLLVLVLLLVLETGPVKDANAAEAEAPSPRVAMFGGSPSRNAVNLTDKGILDNFAVRPKGKEKNVKWSARLGSKAYGGPVVAGGRIFIGTNNDNPRDPKIKGDKGVVMCFRQSDGKFLWQIVHNKIDPANDCGKEGIGSTPCVEGNRLYYVSNRCELVCADAAGDEKTGKGKIIWAYDMIKELDVYPCQLANSSPLIIGDLVYALTGNGVNANGDEKLPSPKAPSLVAINKKTGKLAWRNDLPGAKVMRGQWSNPTAATVAGKTQIIYGGGDGWLYGLDAKTGDLIWKFDCNPKNAGPYKFGGSSKRCFIVATPVIYDNKCYIGVGQEPDEGPGIGHLWCIDITKKPTNKDKDLSPVNDNFDPKAAVNKDSGLVWHYGGPVIPKPKDDDREYVFGRTLSTVCIVDGLVYAPEIAGFLHCVDAKTGKKMWEYDFQIGTWCSPYYVDGKVFLGNDDGNLLIFKAGRKLVNPKVIALGQPVKSPPVAVNGVLYVNGGATLFAIAPSK